MTEQTKSETDELEAALEADKADDTPPQPIELPEPVKVAAKPKPKAKAKPKPKPKPTHPRKTDSPSETRQQKAAASKKMVDQAVAETPPQDITEEEAAELQRRATLQTLLMDTAQEIQNHEDAIEELKARSRDLMAELYPQTLQSDRHVDAVRGYLQASQNERENRGAHPARLRDLLTRAGKAPIDAAFQRARARGMGRPIRPIVGNAAPAAADQAKGATPGAEE